MKVFCYSIITLIIFLVLACSNSSDNGGSKDPLPDITWKCIQIKISNAVFDIDEPENYTILFKTDGSVTIKSDCNTCTGTYISDKDSGTVSLNITCTEKYCPEGTNDPVFSAAIFLVERYEISGAELYLYAENDNRRLHFVKTEL